MVAGTTLSIQHETTDYQHECNAIYEQYGTTRLRNELLCPWKHQHINYKH